MTQKIHSYPACKDYKLNLTPIIHVDTMIKLCLAFAFIFLTAFTVTHAQKRTLILGNTAQGEGNNAQGIFRRIVHSSSVEERDERLLRDSSLWRKVHGYAKNERSEASEYSKIFLTGTVEWQ